MTLSTCRSGSCVENSFCHVQNVALPTQNGVNRVSVSFSRSLIFPCIWCSELAVRFQLMNRSDLMLGGIFCASCALSRFVV